MLFIGYGIRDFIKPESDTGRINLTRCCEVAGLGYTNSKGRARDEIDKRSTEAGDKVTPVSD